MTLNRISRLSATWTNVTETKSCGQLKASRWPLVLDFLVLIEQLKNTRRGSGLLNRRLVKSIEGSRIMSCALFKKIPTELHFVLSKLIKLKQINKWLSRHSGGQLSFCFKHISSFWLNRQTLDFMSNSRFTSSLFFQFVTLDTV